MTAETVLQLINAAGVIGLLIFLVVAFYRGDIISKPMMDKILDRYMAKFDEMLSSINTKLDNIGRGPKDAKKQREL